MKIPNNKKHNILVEKPSKHLRPYSSFPSIWGIIIAAPEKVTDLSFVMHQKLLTLDISRVFDVVSQELLMYIKILIDINNSLYTSTTLYTHEKLLIYQNLLIYIISILIYSTIFTRRVATLSEPQ